MVLQADCPAIAKSLIAVILEVVLDGAHGSVTASPGTCDPQVTVDIHEGSLIVTAVISVDRGRDVPRTTKDVCEAIRYRLGELAPAESPVLHIRVDDAPPRELHGVPRTSSNGRRRHLMRASTPQEGKTLS